MKIFGLSAVGVFLASLVFYFAGVLWYGVVFSNSWMSTQGFAADDFKDDSPLYMLGGFIITVVQVIGLGVVLRWRRVASPTAAASTAAALWLFFALPFSHYAYLYQPHHSPQLLLIDASHLLVGWVAAAVILSLFRAK